MLTDIVVGGVYRCLRLDRNLTVIDIDDYGVLFQMEAGRRGRFSVAFFKHHCTPVRTNLLVTNSLDYITNEELDDDDKQIIHSAIQEWISERKITSSSAGMQANQVREQPVQTTRRGSDRELGVITARILPPIQRDEWALRSQRLREQALNTARTAAVERAMSQLHNMQGGGRAVDPERQDRSSTHHFDWTQWTGHSNR